MPVRKLTEEKQSLPPNAAFAELTAVLELCHVTAAPVLDVRPATHTRETDHGTDPLWPFREAPASVQSNRVRLPKTLRQAGKRTAAPTTAVASPATGRLRAQLPPFAPLMEELEIAGWSSHRERPTSNFHDWMLLGGDRLLVTVGRAAVQDSTDPVDAALVSQAAWAAVRAHAPHAPDAGAVLSLASQTLWSPPAATLSSLAVALVDTTGGNTSVALAGDCLAWRVRAATCERLSLQQPPMGTVPSFNYLSQSFPLALRERLILVADDSSRRSPKVELSLADRFTRLDAESHRRMAAADAVTLVRQIYDSRDCEPFQPTSIAAIRRR
jgi:hypothetical protein